MNEDDRLLAIGREPAGLVERALTDCPAVLDVGSGFGRLALGILDRTTSATWPTPSLR